MFSLDSSLSLFLRLYFEVSPICGIAPRIKIHHSDRSIKLLRQLDQVFESYYLMLKELKGKQEAALRRREKH
jgi:hypothetical protein